MTGYPKKLLPFLAYFIAFDIIPVFTQCNSWWSRHPNCDSLPRDDQCGVVSVQQRVVGGHDATLGQFPWIALLLYVTVDSNGSEKHNFICGGAVISERYVVSAAHCLQDTGTLRIHLGEHQLSSAVDCSKTGECAPEAQDFDVESTIIHPKYNAATNLYDLCLIRLKEKVTFTRYIQPVCLPTDRSFRNERTLIGKQLDLAGWGIYNQEGGNNTQPDVLQTISLPYVPKAQCSRAWGKLSTSKICAGGEEGRDACMGDSGGPLVGQFSPRRSRNRYFLVGVVSYGQGDPCGHPDIPGVYVNVAKLMRWLLDNMTY